MDSYRTAYKDLDATDKYHNAVRRIDDDKHALEDSRLLNGAASKSHDAAPKSDAAAASKELLMAKFESLMAKLAPPAVVHATPAEEEDNHPTYTPQGQGAVLKARAAPVTTVDDAAAAVATPKTVMPRTTKTEMSVDREASHHIGGEASSPVTVAKGALLNDIEHEDLKNVQEPAHAAAEAEEQAREDRRDARRAAKLKDWHHAEKTAASRALPLIQAESAKYRKRHWQQTWDANTHLKAGSSTRTGDYGAQGVPRVTPLREAVPKPVAAAITDKAQAQKHLKVAVQAGIKAEKKADEAAAIVKGHVTVTDAKVKEHHEAKEQVEADHAQSKAEAAALKTSDKADVTPEVKAEAEAKARKAHVEAEVRAKKTAEAQAAVSKANTAVTKATVVTEKAAEVAKKPDLAEDLPTDTELVTVPVPDESQIQEKALMAAARMVPMEEYFQELKKEAGLAAKIQQEEGLIQRLREKAGRMGQNRVAKVKAQLLDQESANEKLRAENAKIRAENDRVKAQNVRTMEKERAFERKLQDKLVMAQSAQEQAKQQQQHENMALAQDLAAVLGRHNISPAEHE